MWLLFIFIAVPIIEISLFVEIGGAIGLWPTLAIVILTALLGSTMLRTQGSAALMQIKTSFQTARDPSRPLAHGALILISGVVLLTPGFFTDAVGLLLLIPQVREMVIAYVSSRVQVQSNFNRPSNGNAREKSDIIEGDYESLDK